MKLFHNSIVAKSLTFGTSVHLFWCLASSQDTYTLPTYQNEKSILYNFNYIITLAE